ncbi:MAG: ABC transporter ATP-binding protein [Chitinophagaceae bacterium]
MIVFSNFKKRFKGNPEEILHIPGLVLDNKIYWLKGRNGAGKTSLVKSMAGLIPFEGEISVDSLTLNNNRMEYRLKVNYAEAEPLYPEFLKGSDLIDLYKYTKKAATHQVNLLLNRFGMSGYVNNKVGSYSSGMTKKLSLLLAFMGNPKLILLDEPFITLDPQALHMVEELIAEYNYNGAGFIIPSHQGFTIPGADPHISMVLDNKTILLS